jgi:hypothetical protein
MIGQEIIIMENYMDKRIISVLMLSMFLFSFALANLESIDSKEIKVDLCYDNKFEFKECDTKDLTQTKIEENTKLLVKSDAVYLINDRKELTKLEDKKDSTIYIHKKTADETYHVDNLNDIPVETYLEFYYTRQPNVITHINKYGDKVRTFNSWEYEWTPKTCTGSGDEKTCSVDGYARILTTLTENSVGSETFPLTFTPSQWVTDNQGYASFDGVDGYVDVSNISVKQYANKTFSVWVKRPVSTSTTFQRIFSDEPTSNQPNSMMLVRPSVNLIGLYTYDGSLKSRAVEGEFLADTWYHFVGVYENNSEMRLYKNGVQLGASVSIGAMNALALNLLRFGSRANAVNDTFEGSLDNVQVWNSSLTQANITALFNYGRETKGICNLITEGQVACYDFDDNSYGDGSGNGNYGTPSGGVSLVPEVNDVHIVSTSDYSIGSTTGLFSILDPDYRYKLLHINYSWEYYTDWGFHRRMLQVLIVLLALLIVSGVIYYFREQLNFGGVNGS